MYCSILANEIKYLKQSLDKFPILFLFLLVCSPSILSKIKWEKFIFISILCQLLRIKLITGQL